MTEQDGGVVQAGRAWGRTRSRSWQLGSSEEASERQARIVLWLEGDSLERREISESGTERVADSGVADGVTQSPRAEGEEKGTPHRKREGDEGFS